MKNKEIGGAAVFMYSSIALTALLAAMLFDAQFIIVQRFNRPIVLRFMNRLASREKSVCTPPLK